MCGGGSRKNLCCSFATCEPYCNLRGQNEKKAESKEVHFQDRVHCMQDEDLPGTKGQKKGRKTIKVRINAKRKEVWVRNSGVPPFRRRLSRGCDISLRVV